MTTPTLAGLEPPPPAERPIGATELKIMEQIAALRADRGEFGPVDEMRAETARALAQNIDRGNLKGRAIGNEAAQMLACIEQLQGDTDAAVDVNALPEETRQFLEGLGSVPRIDRAKTRDNAA